MQDFLDDILNALPDLGWFGLVWVGFGCVGLVLGLCWVVFGGVGFGSVGLGWGGVGWGGVRWGGVGWGGLNRSKRAGSDWFNYLEPPNKCGKGGWVWREVFDSLEFSSGRGGDPGVVFLGGRGDGRGGRVVVSPLSSKLRHKRSPRHPFRHNKL